MTKIKNVTRLFSKLLVSFLKLQGEREFEMCGDEEEMSAEENQRSSFAARCNAAFTHLFSLPLVLVAVFPSFS